MRCEDYGRLIVRHPGARISSDEEQHLQRHLNECGECREALAAQRQVSDILARRSTAMVSPDFANRVMADLPVNPAWLELLNWQRWTFRLAPVAATLVLVAVLGFGETEATRPLEFSDLVVDWVADDGTGPETPGLDLLWQETDVVETWLEVALTTSP